MSTETKIAIVTGGSGTIGSIAVNTFLKAGMQVISMSRSGKPPINFLNSYNSSLQLIKCDITDEQQVKKHLTQIGEKWKIIDILVNAAGIQMPFCKIKDTIPSEWKRNYEVNLFGTYLVIKEAMIYMGKERRSKIINLSGGGSTSSRPQFSAYSSSKAAVVRLTETIADEFKEDELRIDINAIAPGTVLSAMTYEILNNREKAGEKEYNEASKTKNLGGTDPKLLTDFFLFLASEQSDGISGKLLSVLWDDWHNFSLMFKKPAPASLYTLRRIDNKNYFEK